MTPGQDWNELHLSEDPAVEVLQALGYTYVAPEVLEAERESLKQTILTGRLGRALKKLNPWLSDDNTNKAIRTITTVQAASLLDASEKVHTDLTYGISLEQDRSEGKKGQTIRDVVLAGATPSAVQKSPLDELKLRMREAGFITNADYREAYGTTRRQAKTSLAVWIAAGTLKVEGRGRSARYLPGPKWPPVEPETGMAENGPNGPRRRKSQ
jgi:hypothetical protein